VWNEKGDLTTDCHSILDKWRNHYSQLLNAIGVSDVRQREIQTAEPTVPQPSAFEFELPIERIKRRKSPGIDQITRYWSNHQVLIKSQHNRLRQRVEKFALRSINVLILFAINRYCFEWKESTNKGRKTDFSNYRGISLLPITYKMLSNILLSRLTPYAAEIIGITREDFDGTGQLLIIQTRYY
jgi:hypothetical protein